ncbi:prepilin-type N-terminal cleavage/methylation domain-containing protein [Coraliomargarita sp. SDUM461004]|uniref:Prepilin-type N-terminal cleavage/methylation domain-containing protein n=1 Tax=Thalassobacterium sedimentorum TaxID=3041258 RepID=A0ABU1ADY0_9BACT|nr:prepilin-type N-terminal cleavage/methylation domain-containing protein [Coraliomargarita sp. SDUM461004]MDQ8192809.1 prepilin-type N-terminal cleavage/methylation domain-containing protein [Coraliomargarita sp. SDUM461004]
MKRSYFSSPFTCEKCGFTLIELLAGIAITAILAMLLLSGVRQVKDMANSSTNISNIRQIIVGYKMLIVDSGGTVEAFTGGAGNENMIYAKQLYTKGFIDSKKVFFSPFYKDNSDIDFWQWYISYGLNTEVPAWSGSGSAKEFNYMVQSEIDYPLIATTLHPNDEVLERGIFRLRLKADTGNINLVSNGMAHVGFLDGSVRSMSPQELSRVGVESGYEWGENRILFSE